MSTITQFPSGNTQYRIEFDYLARTFVVVTLVNSSNPAMNRVLEVGRDYRFLNPTMIEMLTDQSGFDIVSIHRQTGTDLVVDFRNGSVLTASDLTNAELQAIHIAEEGRDQTVDLAKGYADAAGISAGNAKDSEDEARRIAESIKASGLIGYITRRSFEKGFNVTTWNEVLLWEEDGEYYRWDGELPKTVGAGSTPETSGGIGLGAWVGVGDASLRTELSLSHGASLIGTESGNTVQEEIFIAKYAITPEMYGSAAVTDHTDIFKQMAADAKAHGKKLFAAGNYVLSASANNPITIEVDADFSKATVTCPTNDGNSTSWGNTSILFKIPQQATDVTSLFSSVNYARGMKETGVTGLNGWIGMTSTDVWLQRKGNASASGSPEYKIEVNETDQKGTLSYNHYHTFTSAPTVSYKQFVNELTFKAPKVILDGAGIGWVVFCERNNVNILGNSITSKNNGFAMNFIEFNRCARSYIADYSLDANFPETYLGGYTILLTQASSVTAERIDSPSGWSGIDGNYYRGLTVRDSKLRSVGGHCGVSDVLIQGCTITNHCNGMGWGTWTALNCHHNLSLDKTNGDFWSTKDDYNNSWDGKVIIRDLKVTLHSGCTGHSVVTAMEPKADHGMLGCCPDIYVNNVEYDIANTKSDMDLRTINLGVSGGNNFEQYQVLPQFHTVDGVTFGGGSTRYLANTGYRVIYNERNYTNITSSQMNRINRSGSRYIAKVSNIELERLGRINQDWLNAARVDGFKFTTYGTKQEIYIDRSAHVIPCTSAWTDMTITVTNQRMNKGFLDNAVTRVGNTSYNKIEFISCEVFGVGGTRPTYRSGLFDFVGCVFRWDSDSDKAIAAPATTMGTDFGSGAQVTGRIQSCVIGNAPASGTADATFKSRVINNYVNPGSYATS